MARLTDRQTEEEGKKERGYNGRERGTIDRKGELNRVMFSKGDRHQLMKSKVLTEREIEGNLTFPKSQQYRQRC